MTFLEVMASFVGSMVCVIVIIGLVNIVEGYDFYEPPESIPGWITTLVVYMVFVLLFSLFFEIKHSTEKANKLFKQPEITQIGTFDGCNVSYVNRGNQSVSFYIAKCNNTETRTTIEQHPKTGSKVTTTIVEK